jgi:flagellum-specific ATP synthase
VSALTPAVRERALAAARPRRLGTLTELAGLHLLVTGLSVAIGDLVQVLAPD